MFVYFIPWKDCEGYKTVINSKHFIFEAIMPAHKHFEYIINEDRYTKLKLDT